MNKQFAVVTLSKNRNSFGLQGFIIMAEDGSAYEAAANDLNVPKQGDRLNLATDAKGEPEFARYGWEIPRQLPTAPPKVVKSVFYPPKKQK